MYAFVIKPWLLLSSKEIGPAKNPLRVERSQWNINNAKAISPDFSFSCLSSQKPKKYRKSGKETKDGLIIPYATHIYLHTILLPEMFSCFSNLKLKFSSQALQLYTYMF